MLKLFDYMFYRFCKFYYESGSSSPMFGGLFLLSLMQLLNVFSFVVLVSLMLNFNVINNKLLFAAYYLALVILNGFRYNKFNYEILNERWKNEDKNTQKKKKTAILIYFIVSVLLVLGLMFRK